MTGIWKRSLSGLLALVLVFTMLPLNALAADVQTDATEESTEVTEVTTEATEASSEATEETTEATEASSEATEETTEATEASSEATEETTEATEASSEATEETTEATEELTGAAEDAMLAEEGTVMTADDFEDWLDDKIEKGNTYLGVPNNVTIDRDLEITVPADYWMDFSEEGMVLTVEEGCTFTIHNGTSTAEGVYPGQLDFRGTTVNVDGTLVLDFDTQPINVQDGLQFDDTGKLPGARFNVSGELRITQDTWLGFNDAGTELNITGLVNNNGELSVYKGVPATVETGGVVNNHSELYVTGTFINRGTVNNHGTVTNRGGVIDRSQETRWTGDEPEEVEDLMPFYNLKYQLESAGQEGPEDCFLTSNVTVPEYQTLTIPANVALVIGDGRKLTVKEGASVNIASTGSVHLNAGGAMSLSGTLTNNGKLHVGWRTEGIDKNSVLTVTAKGKLVNKTGMYIYAKASPEDTDPTAFGRVVVNGVLENASRLEVRGSLELQGSGRLTNAAKGTVPVYGTMTVEETATVENAGKVTVASAPGTLNVYGTWKSNLPTVQSGGILNAPGFGLDTLIKLGMPITGNTVLTKSLTVKTALTVAEGGHIIVPKGKVLTIDASGSLLLAAGAKLTVQSGGKLVNKGSIQLNNGAVLTVNSGGTLTNSKRIQMYAGAELTVENSKNYTNGTNAEILLQGQTTAEGVRIPSVSSGIAKYVTIQFVPETDPVNQLRAISLWQQEKNYPKVLVYFRQDVTLEDELTVPGNIGLTIQAPAKLTVASGATMNINGLVTLTSGTEPAELFNNGTIVLNQNGLLDNDGEYHGTIPEFNGGKMSPFPNTKSVTIRDAAGAAKTKHTQDVRSPEDLILDVSVELADPSVTHNSFVTWTSTKTSVVDAGQIYRNAQGLWVIPASAFLAPGSATLKATSDLGTGKAKSAAIAVTVTAGIIKSLSLTNTLPGQENSSTAKLHMEKAKYSFTIRPTATDAWDSSENFLLTSSSVSWSSSNTKLATVSTNSDGSAAVTVKANQHGTVTFTVTSRDANKASAQLTLVVTDYTPKLSASKVTIDPMQEEPEVLNVTIANDNEVDTVSVADPRLNVRYQEGRLYITRAQTASLPSNETIKTTLTLTGKLTGKAYTYDLTATIKSVLPKVKLTQEGKINLYDLSSTAKLVVKVNGKVPEEALTMTLSGGTGEPDFFLLGDEIGLTDAYARKVEANPKYKAVTKVTVSVIVPDYLYPVPLSFSVGTVNTVPKLSSDPASTTVNTAIGEANTVSFQIYDKTGKKILDLDDSYTLTPSAGTLTMNADTDTVTVGFGAVTEENPYFKGKLTVQVRKNTWSAPVALTHTVSHDAKLPTLSSDPASTTVNTAIGEANTVSFQIYDKTGKKILDLDDSYTLTPSAGTLTMNTETDTVTVDFGEVTEENPYFKGKLTLTVKGSKWNEAASLTHTVAHTTKLPTLKPETATLTLHNQFTDNPYTLAVLSASTVPLSSVGDFASTAKADSATWKEAQKIKVEYVAGAITATVRDHSRYPKPGNYAFEATPVLEGDVELAKVKITVKVVNTMPTVKLKTSSVTLNTNLAGTEVIEIPVTMTNKTGWDLELKDFRVDKNDDGKVAVTYENGTLKVSLDSGMTDSLDLNKTETIKLELYPIVEENRDEITLDSVKLPLTIKAQNKAITVTQGVSGKLDTLKPENVLTYTVRKVNNAVGTVTDVQFADDSEYDQETFDLSGLSENAKGQQTFTLKLKENVPYTTKTKYKVKFQYTILNTLDVDSSVQSIQVSQTAFTATNNRASVHYAKGDLTLPQISLAAKSPEGVAIGQVLLNTKTSKELKTALNLGDDLTLLENGTQTSASLSLTLSSDTSLTAGKTYSLVLDVYPAGYAEGGKFATVTTKVKVSAAAVPAPERPAPGGGTSGSGNGKLIGISSAGAWSDTEQQELAARLEAQGYRIAYSYAQNDAITQRDQIQVMLAEGVDCLIVDPVDADTLSNALADAQACGIFFLEYAAVAENPDIVSDLFTQ